MKKFIFSAALLGSVFLVRGQQTAFSAPQELSQVPVARWEKTSVDLGKIKLNQPGTAVFTFTNSGSGALIISEVKPSCSCTVSEFTKNPVQPGQKGMVKAQYNASKLGVFHKTVSVLSNSEGGMQTLDLQGVVVE